MKKKGICTLLLKLKAIRFVVCVPNGNDNNTEAKTVIDGAKPWHGAEHKNAVANENENHTYAVCVEQDINHAYD